MTLTREGMSNGMKHRRPDDECIYDETKPLLSTNGNRDGVLPSLRADDEMHVPTPPPWDLSYHWERYNALLEKKPLLVKALTALFILGSADLFAQTIEFATATKSFHYKIDWPRSARFGIFGLFGAPWSHYYFDYLDYYLPPTEQPWTTITLVKVVIDQFIQAPILLAIMICALTLMKGDGYTGMKNDMKETYVDSLIANWKLWLPASAINIAFVKPSLRVLYVNVVFFAWTVILSLLLNNKSSAG